ncbi:molybdopterin-guanine dinucleotide biosynthesis protein B [Candidatus Bathyarchaeota archaeon]|nr:molybdopterin-guanine dinucleotide biosynthesis protein B [Candidatus Bathyarchaeota archaeon]
MTTPIVAIIGGKKSGKTTAMQALIKELSQRGYKVAAVKHIPEKDFTIDTVNKDTWKFAMAGAKTIVSIAPNEVAIIEKAQTSSISLDEIREKCKGSSIILLEGFRSLVGWREDIPKIVAVKSPEDFAEALESFKPIIAFTGPYNPKPSPSNPPYINVLEDSVKIADIVESFLREKGII